MPLSLASTMLFFIRPKTGPPEVPLPGVRATALTLPMPGLCRTIPPPSPANSRVPVSAARSELTPSPTTPNGYGTNNRPPPPPPPPPDNTPSPIHNTAAPPEYFHFFWDSSSVFSQWYLCDIEHEGVTYTCAEQMTMEHKVELFGGTASKLRIRTALDPGGQKALGRIVSGVDVECVGVLGATPLR